MQPVVLYTLAGCPFCERAKALFDSKGAPYQEIDVSAAPEERMLVSRRTGHRTFPQIFIGEEFVGGCDDVQALDRAGRLDSMLA